MEILKNNSNNIKNRAVCPICNSEFLYLDTEQNYDDHCDDYCDNSIVINKTELKSYNFVNELANEFSTNDVSVKTKIGFDEYYLCITPLCKTANVKCPCCKYCSDVPKYLYSEFLKNPIIESETIAKNNAIIEHAESISKLILERIKNKESEQERLEKINLLTKSNAKKVLGNKEEKRRSSIWTKIKQWINN